MAPRQVVVATVLGRQWVYALVQSPDTPTAAFLVFVSKWCFPSLKNCTCWAEEPLLLRTGLCSDFGGKGHCNEVLLNHRTKPTTNRKKQNQTNPLTLSDTFAAGCSVSKLLNHILCSRQISSQLWKTAVCSALCQREILELLFLENKCGIRLLGSF